MQVGLMKETEDTEQSHVEVMEHVVPAAVEDPLTVTRTLHKFIIFD